MKRFVQHRLPLIEKWLMLPGIYHGCFFLFCLSAVNFPIVFDIWQTYQQHQQIEQAIEQQSSELAHQEKLLTTLKQHSDWHALSPKLTKQIVALDEQIHGQLNDDLELMEYQWDFSSRPVLQIQLAGRFQHLHEFLTALLAQQHALSFAQIEMQKMENGSVQSHVILQLNREEER